MKKIILLLLLTSVSLFAQKETSGSIGLDYNSFTTPSGCSTAANVVAFEINVLNADSTIAAFAYMDFETAYNYSSDEGIVVGSADSTFTIVDPSYTLTRTRVAQTCKIGCCKKVIKWTDWVYELGSGGTIPTINANDDSVPISEPGTVTVVNASSNDSSNNCEPITYAVSNEVNCTVINNGDGTFDVTPTVAGLWSFEYTATCSDGSTSDVALVSGEAYEKIEGEPCFTFIPFLKPDYLDCNSATNFYQSQFTGNFYAWDANGDCSVSNSILCNKNYLYHLIGTAYNSDYPISIDWGDGTTSVAGGTSTFHNYTTGGTFNVTVTSDCDGTVIGNTSITVICNVPGNACTALINVTRPFFFTCNSAFNGYANSFSPSVYTFDNNGNCGASKTNEIFTNQAYQFYFNTGASSTGFTVTIDWGDGNTEPYTGPLTHTYLSTGVYNITLINDCDGVTIGAMTVTVI